MAITASVMTARSSICRALRIAGRSRVIHRVPSSSAITGCPMLEPPFPGREPTVRTSALRPHLNCLRGRMLAAGAYLLVRECAQGVVNHHRSDRLEPEGGALDLRLIHEFGRDDHRRGHARLL